MRDNINRLSSNKIVYYSILLCLFIEREVNMKQKQKWFILFVTVMSLFSLIFLAKEQSVASEVKELEKVVTGVTLLDQLDTAIEPDKDGV